MNRSVSAIRNCNVETPFPALVYTSIALNTNEAFSEQNSLLWASLPDDAGGSEPPMFANRVVVAFDNGDNGWRSVT